MSRKSTKSTKSKQATTTEKKKYKRYSYHIYGETSPAVPVLIKTVTSEKAATEDIPGAKYVIVTEYNKTPNIALMRFNPTDEINDTSEELYVLTKYRLPWGEEFYSYPQGLYVFPGGCVYGAEHEKVVDLGAVRRLS